MKVILLWRSFRRDCFWRVFRALSENKSHPAFSQSFLQLLIWSIWSAYNITSTITAKTTHFYYERAEGFCRALRKPANPWQAEWGIFIWFEPKEKGPKTRAWVVDFKVDEIEVFLFFVFLVVYELLCDRHFCDPVWNLFPLVPWGGWQVPCLMLPGTSRNLPPFVPMFPPYCISPCFHPTVSLPYSALPYSCIKRILHQKKLASLEATLVRNYDRLTDRITHQARKPL